MDLRARSADPMPLLFRHRTIRLPVFLVLLCCRVLPVNLDGQCAKFRYLTMILIPLSTQEKFLWRGVHSSSIPPTKSCG